MGLSLLEDSIEYFFAWNPILFYPEGFQWNGFRISILHQDFTPIL